MHLKDTVKQEAKLKDFLQHHWKISGRLLTDLKKDKTIFVNGRPRTVDYRLKPGDEVLVRLDYEKNTYEAFPYELDVVYEDAFLLVINKDAGMTVHPTKGSFEGTLLHAISYYQMQNDEDYKIRFAHRLDHDTSGVIIIAKNKYAHHQLSEQFVARKVEKTYWAIVHGVTKEQFVVEGMMGQTEAFARVFTPEGKYSLTEFLRLDHGSDWSLVEARPQTGRTHQIRLHLKEAGHPIIGDELYGIDEGPRHFLHGYSITVNHPLTGERRTFVAKLKPDMQSFLEKNPGR